VLNYIEKGDVDMDAGRILSFSIHGPRHIPGRAKFVLRTGDVLFPNAYDCMRGVAVVTPEHSGYIGSSRFFAVRPNLDRILPEYIPYHFRRPEVLALLKRQCSGEINPGINWPAFSRIKVPLPSIAQQNEVLQRIGEILEEKARMSKAMARLDERLEGKIATVVPKLITNYEDVKIRRAEFIAEVKLS